VSQLTAQESTAGVVCSGVLVPQEARTRTNATKTAVDIVFFILHN
jgi:hypothetical protein